MSRKLCLSLTLLVFSSLPCFAQQTAQQGAQQTVSAGYAACPAGEGYVYLYRSPDDFTVLANLKCGARIEILGSGNGYVAARTADGKQGYILLSAVTTAAYANAGACIFVREQPAAARPCGDVEPVFRKRWSHRNLRRIFLFEYGPQRIGRASAREWEWLSVVLDPESQSVACRRRHSRRVLQE